MTDEPRHPLCEHFLGWQCRVRQKAVREGGRPTPGMQPLLRFDDEAEAQGPVSVLIVKREPQESTARFRHIVKCTHDPAERYKEAIGELSAAYYQRPREFAEVLTALFAGDSAIARRLTGGAPCALLFEQFSQRYTLPCTASPLAGNDPLYQATFWHNSMFNAAIPGGVQVLAFQPGWSSGVADPPIPAAG